jgi:hypothetical protein
MWFVTPAWCIHFSGHAELPNLHTWHTYGNLMEPKYFWVNMVYRHWLHERETLICVLSTFSYKIMLLEIQQH